MKSSNRVEWIAIPIVAVIFGIGLILFIASVEGVWAWLFVGAAGLLLAGVLVARFSRRHPHPASAQPAPATGAPEESPARGRSVPDPRDRRRELCRSLVRRRARPPRRRPHGRGARDRARDRLVALAVDGRRVAVRRRAQAPGRHGGCPRGRPESRHGARPGRTIHSRLPTTACGSSPPTRWSSSRRTERRPTGSSGGSSRLHVPATRSRSRRSCSPPTADAPGPAALRARARYHVRRRDWIGPCLCFCAAACMLAALAVDLDSTAAKVLMAAAAILFVPGRLRDAWDGAPDRRLARISSGGTTTKFRRN